jgi:hypothetical protein
VAAKATFAPAFVTSNIALIILYLVIDLN